MTRKQPMTLQLQQQWRKDGEKSDQQTPTISQAAEAASEQPSAADRTTNQ